VAESDGDAAYASRPHARTLWELFGGIRQRKPPHAARTWPAAGPAKGEVVDAPRGTPGRAGGGGWPFDSHDGSA